MTPNPRAASTRAAFPRAEIDAAAVEAAMDCARGFVASGYRSASVVRRMAGFKVVITIHETPSPERLSAAA